MVMTIVKMPIVCSKFMFSEPQPQTKSWSFSYNWTNYKRAMFDIFPQKITSIFCGLTSHPVSAVFNWRIPTGRY